MKKIISILLLFTFGFSSCEKDDICDANTPTTPRLVISFYETASPTVPKNVINLQVIGDGAPDGKGIIFNENDTTDNKYLANGNTISIPLKTDANTVTYSFIFNSLSANDKTTDVIKINYTHDNVYVSRACGYKTTFKLLPIEPIQLTEPAQWIRLIKVKQSNIETENETHLEILF